MEGVGRAVFAATLLMIAGLVNIIYGIGALDGANIFVDDQRYILSDLNTMGWVLIILGAIQITGGFSLFVGNAYGRVIGLVGAGLGAIGAMRQALHRAGLPPRDVDWVNLHGTGTRANDAAEDRAVASVFGDAVPCSSTKGWTGHTLGACGILEAVIAGECMADGFVAVCLGIDAPDPAFRAQVAVGTLGRPVRTVVSNSFGFGGTNCSLVLGMLH